jgi:intraflagellar transport protein 172
LVGNFDRFYVYNFNTKRPQWDEICCKKIENYYSVTAACWKLYVGSICGSVKIFEICLKKARFKGKF